MCSARAWNGTHDLTDARTPEPQPTHTLTVTVTSTYTLESDALLSVTSQDACV